MLFTELKTQNNGLTLYHTALYEPSLQGADPWSIPLELFKRTILASAPQDVVWNGPGISRLERRFVKQRGWPHWSVVQLVLDVMRNRIALG